MKIRTACVFISISLLLCACGGLYSLEKALQNPEGERKLLISKTSLSRLPSSISKLQDLEVLVLSFNKLDSLPDEIGELSKLRRLTLQSNELTAIPASIGNLQNLEMLDLRFNKLTSLPASLGQLKKLRFLYLSENQLTSIPESLASLTKLEILHIGKNELPAGPVRFDITDMENLQEISLNNSGPMLQVPEDWGRHPRLERLYLDRTALLPPNFAVANARLRVYFSSPDLRSTGAN
ncbi:MAG: leucine-rich repeat domain-containing protein [Bacteroidia bacterium]